MTDDKREVNPHTGQTLPPEPDPRPVHGTGTPPATGTSGAAAASAEAIAKTRMYFMMLDEE